MVSRSLWLKSAKQNSKAKIRLFCFPYAGGSEAAYGSWQQSLPETIAVLPIQLPGRGSRMNEPAFCRLAPLVSALGQGLAQEMELPFAFFGHSMGGLIAFELARQLRKENRPLPVHLFISAKCCPQHSEDLSAGKLSDPELIDLLRRYEGTPEEVLGNDELMQLVLPIIRADMEVCNTYQYEPEPPLECPITVFGGLEDHRSYRGCLEGWQNHTSGRFTIRMFRGGHFFVQTWQKPLLEIVARELSSFTVAKENSTYATFIRSGQQSGR